MGIQVLDFSQPHYAWCPHNVKHRPSPCLMMSDFGTHPYSKASRSRACCELQTRTQFLRRKVCNVCHDISWSWGHYIDSLTNIGLAIIQHFVREGTGAWNVAGKIMIYRDFRSIWSKFDVYESSLIWVLYFYMNEARL